MINHNKDISLYMHVTTHTTILVNNISSKLATQINHHSNSRATNLYRSQSLLSPLVGTLSTPASTANAKQFSFLQLPARFGSTNQNRNSTRLFFAASPLSGSYTSNFIMVVLVSLCWKRVLASSSCVAGCHPRDMKKRPNEHARWPLITIGGQCLAFSLMPPSTLGLH